MAVYVDDMYKYPIGEFGRMKMSHLMADTTQELLEVVDTIGVQRKWIQNPGTYREHFDISMTKRALAVDAGAIEISMRELSRFGNEYYHFEAAFIGPSDKNPWRTFNPSSADPMNATTIDADGKEFVITRVPIRDIYDTPESELPEGHSDD